MTKETSSFTLSERVREVLEADSDALGISMSEFIERAILHYDATKVDKDLKKDIQHRQLIREAIRTKTMHLPMSGYLITKEGE